MSRMLDRMSDDEVSRAFPVDAEAGFGALATERGRLPLAAVDVRARLDGLLGQVTVCQTFVNSFSDAVEATYVFPLPDRAAVTHFRMEVGGRVIEGRLKERGQARRDYDNAIRSGHRAAITEEDRAGVFSMRVGNLMPGEEATVRLTLAGPLPYADGEATFRFPLVVAPRYIPGVPLPGPAAGDGTAADTDAVPDASRISPPVLLPGFPNPVRLSLCVEILPSGPAVGEVRSSLHAVEEETAGRVRRITLLPGARLDRDFILRLRLGDGRLRTSLSLHPDPAGQREGTFLLTVSCHKTPPGQAVPRPRDIVFVLDRSGSMQGWKMVAARRAVARMVDTLLDQDRFAVLAFDDRVETPPPASGAAGVRLVDATDRQRFRAVEFLAQIDSRGGTEMAQPLEMAVRELSEAGAGRERILVLITDGQVGNEDQILHALGSRLRQLRVFCLGIDRAVNAAFLNRLAEMGGGACELVESEDRLDEVMEHIHRRIAQPVLTRVRLEPSGVVFEADSLVPGRLPDVFAGSPLLVLGRYHGAAEGSVVLQAEDAGGQPWQTTVRGTASDNPALVAVWARGQVRKLEDRYLVEADRQRLERRIVETSLRFGVLSRFTAFVAVDLSAVVNPAGTVRDIVQPVEMPEGWGREEKSSGSLSAVSCLSAPPPCARAPSTDFDSEDLLLRDYDSAEDNDSRPIRASGPGLLQRMFGLFRMRKPAAARSVSPTPTDLAPLQEHARALEELVRAAMQCVPARRWSSLLALATGLEGLLKDLVSAGVLTPEAERLARLLQQLHALRAEADAGADPAHLCERPETEALWHEAQAALRAFLGVSTPNTEAPRREGFWK